VLSQPRAYARATLLKEQPRAKSIGSERLWRKRRLRAGSYAGF
jgi:hypothetical protein